MTTLSGIADLSTPSVRGANACASNESTRPARAAPPWGPEPPLQSANGRGAGDRACPRRRATAVAAVARARDGGHPGVLARAPGADAQRGGQPHRHHARDGAPDPAHAREARARALRRAAVLAHPAPADPRLGLPLVAEPLRARAAADGDAGRGDARVVLGRDPRPARRGLRRARAHAADHVDHAERRHAPAGALHVDGPRAAGRAAARRARPLPHRRHARGVDRAHDDRSRPPARRARRDAPARLGAGRPGARDRPALGGGAHPPRPGHDRRAQRLLGGVARVARRPAPADPAAAGRRRRTRSPTR